MILQRIAVFLAVGNGYLVQRDRIDTALGEQLLGRRDKLMSGPRRTGGVFVGCGGIEGEGSLLLQDIKMVAITNKSKYLFNKRPTILSFNMKINFSPSVL